MEPPKKNTINDVARLAKVSKKTVSRVINDEPGVRTTTRNHVLHVIDKLNYFPDPQARGLASRRSFLLALMYDNPNASFVTDAMYGVLDRCRSKGYELVIHPCDSGDESLIDDISKFIRRMKIDGVILLPPLSDSEVLAAKLKDMGCNYVRLLSVATDDPAHMIHFNDRVAVRAIANHLVDLGHTNIGFIHGPEGSQAAIERYEGFRDALAVQNIALPISRIGRGMHTFQSGVACTEWLLNASQPPTAIFASNDEMAMGVMVAAMKMGFKIPADLTVVGFDDSPHSTEVWPALTTVNLHVRQMGQLATDKLLLLCSKDIQQAAAIPYQMASEFIQRQSTAAPRNIDKNTDKNTEPSAKAHY